MLMQKIFYSLLLCICKSRTHIFIMITQNWSLVWGFGVTDKLCFQPSHRSKITRWYYCQFSISKTGILLTRLFQSLQISMDRLYRLIKTKSTKSKAKFLRTSFLKMKIIRLVQGHWSGTSTHWNSIFYSYTYEKTFSSSLC